MSDKKTIVIVGGGAAGNELWTKLGDKKYNNVDVILISKTNFFYFTVATPRTLTDEKYVNDVCIPFDKVINDYRKFIHGEVTNIGVDELTYAPIVENAKKGEAKLKFDYLVLALGSTYNEPFNASEYSINEQIKKLKEMNGQLKNADRVLVLGGGPVGIETAGEIATDYPNKKVVLVTNADRLIHTMPQALSLKALEVLTQKNVEVLFNDSVDISKCKKFEQNQKITTKNGKSIDFDAFIQCIGNKPCTGIIEKTNPEWLNKDRRIQVNDEFLVKGKTNVFAIGDCCDTNETKLLFLAREHANILTHNLDQIINNKKNMKKYTPQTILPFMGVSIGRDNGALMMKCMTFKGFLPKLIKSKSLFLPSTRKSFGYN